jgi:hypothetical protein
MVLGHLDEAMELIGEVKRELLARKLRVFMASALDAAAAEVALAGLQAGTVSLRDARDACNAVDRWGHRYRMALPTALRLQGQIAQLSDRPQRASKIWYRGVSIAEKLGAHYELSLLRRELGMQASQAGRN